jgi:hypothetical protein
VNFTHHGWSYGKDLKGGRISLKEIAHFHKENLLIEQVFNL